MTSLGTELMCYRSARQERTFHNANANKVLPKIFGIFDYKRCLIISSRTLNTKTDVIRKIETALGNKVVGITDDIGEHAPVQNVLKAARLARDLKIDSIVAIGGGSVMDLSKLVQMCLTHNTFDKEGLLALEFEMAPQILDVVPASHALPSVDQIFIPTTMATAEWTNASTPKDEDTQLKARFLVHDGGPRTIIYDPEIMAQSPVWLLMSTAIRGMDHAINNSCALEPHPISSLLGENSAKLFIENLPAIKSDPTNREAMHNCQLATAYSGMGVMSVVHSFSHWVVHVIGPYANVAHSDTACVAMLVQAKWLDGYADEQHGAILRLLGRENEKFHDVLKVLLKELELPTSWQDLGISRELLDEMAPHILAHPWMTRFNLRPIKTLQDVKDILELGWAV